MQQSSGKSTFISSATGLDSQFGDLTIQNPQAAAKFESPALQQTTSYGNDEKPINAKGQYDLTQTETFYDNVEFEEDLAEKQLADADNSNMDKVMNIFNGFLENKFKKQSTISSSQSYEESKDTFRDEGALANKKQDLRDAMGPSVYNFYYDFLYKARTNPATDEAVMRAQLKEMVGSNKELKNLIFSLEQIIFREVQQELLQ